MSRNFFAKRRELGRGGQMPEKHEMRDFFKARIGREIVDVVSAIGETAEFTLYIAQVGVTDHDAFEARVDYGMWRQWKPPGPFDKLRVTGCAGLIEFED